MIRFLLSHPNLEGLSLPPKTCLLFSLFHFVSVAFRSSIRKRMSNYINSNRFESSLFSRRLFHLYTAAQNESQVNKNHQWHLAKPIFKNRTSPFDMKNTWVLFLCVFFFHSALVNLLSQKRLTKLHFDFDFDLDRFGIWFMWFLWWSCTQIYAPEPFVMHGCCIDICVCIALCSLQN